jgi:hypothetical protein
MNKTVEQQIIELQDELIQLLEGQVTELTVLSKIELGNDVIWKVIDIKNQIKEITGGGEATWWRGNPDINNTVTGEKTTSEMETEMTEMIISESVFGGKDSCIVDAKSMGDTTIQPPKPNKPEQYNPNKPMLNEMTFRFTQEANCVDGMSEDVEELIVEAKSSLGIDGDGGAFFVLRTEQWAFDGVNEFEEIRTLLKRVENAVNATNPTSIHLK